VATSLNGLLHDDSPIVVGLVNNMPDAALESTERQFRSLLGEASSGRSVRLRLFSIPQSQRSEAAHEYLQQHYEHIDALWNAGLDGLIVTGAQPRARRVAEEPCWPDLIKIVEWAEDHTTSAIWSCLAAHVAVRHLDGIERRRFERKLSGVFECVKVAEHPLVYNAPSRWRVPHSRYYNLPEEELIAGDYHIVSRSSVVGADIFTKQRNSLSVFVQGHPEYEPDTLFREYRRDIRAFVAGETQTFPQVPCGYFAGEIEAKFVDFQEKLWRAPLVDRGWTFPQTDKVFAHTWRQSAIRLYSNWLSYLVEGRRRRAASRLFRVESQTA